VVLAEVEAVTIRAAMETPSPDCVTTWSGLSTAVSATTDGAAGRTPAPVRSAQDGETQTQTQRQTEREDHDEDMHGVGRNARDERHGQSTERYCEPDQ
jgi:hypothetical protein